MSVKEKTAIRQALAGTWIGYVTLTHNLDGIEYLWEPLYRAWAVWVRAEGDAPKGRPINRDRTLPGGITIGQVLTRAAAILAAGQNGAGQVADPEKPA